MNWLSIGIASALVALVGGSARAQQPDSFMPTAGGLQAKQGAMWCANVVGVALPCTNVTRKHTISGSWTAATTSGSLFAGSAAPTFLQICNYDASANVWLNTTNGIAAVNSGMEISAGGGCVTFGGPLLPIPTDITNGLSDGSHSVTLAVTGG
jgi:hypothetical protein